MIKDTGTKLNPIFLNRQTCAELQLWCMGDYEKCINYDPSDVIDMPGLLARIRR